MHIDVWLESVPPNAVYALVGVIILLESLGIPLPGEIALVTASVLAASGVVNPWLVAACAIAGAIIGDSIGYSIGRKGGKPLFEKLGRKFPKHFGPDHLATAERSFQKWGMWAVFFGRFIALLRIFAGPLAGSLKMPYWKFLIANVLGGVIWAGGTTWLIYTVGKAAEQWLKSFSWVGLILAALFGAGSAWVLKRRAAKHRAEHPETSGGQPAAEGEASAEAGTEAVPAPAAD
ncbi:membrane protein DedA with SNARE-associated domain [Kitasatospora gansuensis]|uniref:Membrane protein DedA with SNARE-associated domain n=1 Tax=Kitasatospora gansuensis TaxID=258050 RepID=A0A7W7S6C8_9ACTN|nr:DedA family protein [Kitasatospora gansuensis]MBB4944736.1 membrane protein DedA with SNARE-associated domain [Kitasatospora gansuensis]